MLDSGIKSPCIAKKLKSFTRWSAYAGLVSAMFGSALAIYVYAFPCLDDYYRDRSVMHQIVYRASFCAITLGAIPCYLQVFCGIVITIVIQLLVVMNVASSLDALGFETPKGDARCAIS